MKIYTGRGDDGSTDLLGARVEKDDPRIELLGSLDEATSSIGLARALARAEGAGARLVEVQRDLYRIMAELAFTDELRPAGYELGQDRVERITSMTDELSASIELSPQFVLPGETVPGAAFDVARTVVRRAERHAVRGHGDGLVRNERILQYLNRLSSLLFIMARAEEAVASIAPVRAKGDG